MSAQAKVQILPGQRLLFDFASHEIIIGKPLEFLLNSARTHHTRRFQLHAQQSLLQYWHTQQKQQQQWE